MKAVVLPKVAGLYAISPFSTHPRRAAGDWEEDIPSREHIPVLTRLADSVQLSSRLSKLPVIGRESKKDVIRMIPEEVLSILKIANIECVLVGAHGAGGWMAETRATQDVDILIRTRSARAAMSAVLAKFPALVLEKYPDVYRFKQGEQYVLDLMLTRAPLMKRVFVEYLEIKLNRRMVKVPKLEAAMAMKFAAMVGHGRNLLKKGRDALDFISMISANQRIDLEFLRELGELVYEGGGHDIVQYVDDVRAGRRIEI